MYLLWSEGPKFSTEMLEDVLECIHLIGETQYSSITIRHYVSQ